jgi:hypothetical protein
MTKQGVTNQQRGEELRVTNEKQARRYLCSSLVAHHVSLRV